MVLSYGDIFKPQSWRLVITQYVKVLPPYMYKHHKLRPKDYTLVGSGFSGGLVVIPVAEQIGSRVCIVRKESEKSHGMAREGMWDTSIPWVFLDDFVDTGATRDRCIQVMKSDPIAQLFYGSHANGKNNSIWAL